MNQELQVQRAIACRCTDCPGAACECGCKAGIASAAACGCGTGCGCEGGEQGCVCS